MLSLSQQEKVTTLAGAVKTTVCTAHTHSSKPGAMHSTAQSTGSVSTNIDITLMSVSGNTTCAALFSRPGSCMLDGGSCKLLFAVLLNSAVSGCELLLTVSKPACIAPDWWPGFGAELEAET